MATYAEQLERIRKHKEAAKELTFEMLKGSASDLSIFNLKMKLREANGHYAADEHLPPSFGFRKMRRP